MQNNELKDIDCKALGAHIVVYRHLGINKELAIECMEELCTRREHGDEFNFEQYIEDQLKDMPAISINEKDKSILSKLFKTDLLKTYGK